MNCDFKGLIAFLTALWISLCSVLFPSYYYSNYCDFAKPSNLSTAQTREVHTVTDADFYVSAVNGDDTGDGSFSSPFATLNRARDAVRELDREGREAITVAIMAGEYRVSTVEFLPCDSGTQDCPVTYCAYGDGEVVLNGGATLATSDFSSVSDAAMLSRLCDEAQKNVVSVDLTAAPYNLTVADWGKLYAIGEYNTASHYTGDYVGSLYSEIFFNDARMLMARYPNAGEFLRTGEVVSEGEGLESADRVLNVDFNTSVDPVSDVYKLSPELSERLASWQSFDDVWMYGYWRYDWADAATPVGEVDFEKQTISPKFVSMYGAIEGANYYFYNSFEELDEPGEYYLDRETGIFYLWPSAEMSTAKIDLSLTRNNLIMVTNAEYLTFRGLTLKGTRGDAAYMKGNHLTVEECLIKNVSGNALRMTGYNNRASHNEICHTGRGGIILTGGDIVTLKSGNNVADNNLIHDWSEIYLTYQPAVRLSGVGNVCSHNEIFNSPHEAITWDGNNHLIEYNNVHDVCLLGDDAGAIYSGRRWDWYGTVIRYNCIYNLGADGHKPCGIYIDDCLSGIEVYGNLLVNVPSIALHLGGGRDLKVYGNIVVNSGVPVSYDSRGRTGAVDEAVPWAELFGKDGYTWKKLYESPWKSEIWQEAYPQYKSYVCDFSQTDSPWFPANPAMSKVTGNIVFSRKDRVGNISEAATLFSDISGNAVYSLDKIKRIFVDPDNGDYTLKDGSNAYELIPEFEAIPYGEIGRK